MKSQIDLGAGERRSQANMRATWLDTADLEQQKQICVDLQKQLWEDVPFIPMGEYWQATAYRKHLTDILPGCFATFYGVHRA